MTLPTRLHLPLLLLAAAFLFGLNLGGYDLWPADEPRYAQVAREMMLSDDYLVPHVNGEVYLEKPPFLMWIQAAFSWPVGDVTEVTARLPSVLSALVVLLFTYLLARRLFGPKTALWSALVLMTTQRFWWQARTGQIDMLLTACMMASLYALWRWDQDRRSRWLVMLYVGVAAGMLAKGPPALLFPVICILAFYWRDPASRRQTRWVIGSLSAIAVTAAWYLPARLLSTDIATDAVQSSIGGNLFRNVIGRVFLGVSKAQPPWYYVVETIPLDLLPWTLLLPWAVWWIWRTRNDSAMHRFLWCWTIPTLILFSLSIGKRAIYILPLFPVFAIWIAASLQQFEQATETSKRVVRGMLALLFAAMAAGTFGAAWLLDEPEIDVNPVFALGPLLALALILRPTRLPGGYANSRKIVYAMVALFTAGALYALPIANQVKGASEFCKPLRQLTEEGRRLPPVLGRVFARGVRILHEAIPHAGAKRSGRSRPDTRARFYPDRTPAD